MEVSFTERSGVGNLCLNSKKPNTTLPDHHKASRRRGQAEVISCSYAEFGDGKTSQFVLDAFVFGNPQLHFIDEPKRDIDGSRFAWDLGGELPGGVGWPWQQRQLRWPRRFADLRQGGQPRGGFSDASQTCQVSFTTIRAILDRTATQRRHVGNQGGGWFHSTQTKLEAVECSKESKLQDE